MMTDCFPETFEDFEDIDIEGLEEELAMVDFENNFDNYVANYYKFNPDTLMPLLFLALAARDRIRVSQNPSQVEGAYRSFPLLEMKNLNWVKEDIKLRRKISSLISRGYTSVDIEFDLDIQTAAAYTIFVKNDEETVVQEHHHRIGRLIDHRDDRVSFMMHQKYSALRLVRFLISNKNFVKKDFANLYHKVLVKSGLQPERPRLVVANAITALAEYSGEGTVYVPFAGVGIVGAMLGPLAGDRLYVDGDANPKLLACGRLLNYGMGGNNSHFKFRDSLQWLSTGPLELVISTYRGFPSGKSAFSFSYEKSMETLSETGKYIGVIPSSTLFESDQKNHPEVLDTIKDSVDKDYLDTIVLMPFNESIVLFRKNKPTPGKVRIYSRLNSFVQAVSLESMLKDESCAKVVSCKEISRKKYRLKSFVVTELRKSQGREVVSASEFLSRLKRKVYPTDSMDYREKAMLMVDRDVMYETLPVYWNEGTYRQSFSELFDPVYRLDAQSMIINSKGAIEPRFFDPEDGPVFFEDGFAFGLKPGANINWLRNELEKPYVQDQLYPYGKDTMLPNKITEDAILSLKFYKPVTEEEREKKKRLAIGYILNDPMASMEYKILGYCSNGAFGITYRALQKDLRNGDTSEVVLKEFFLSTRSQCYRDGDKVCVKKGFEENFDLHRDGFRKEAGILMSLGQDSKNHIMKVLNCFDSEKTGTSYYVMNNYRNGSLFNLMERTSVLDEAKVIEHVVKPLAQALHIVHANNILHLDIKPENIMLDDNMDATLTDFGIAKSYDKGGQQLDENAPLGTREFAAPEQWGEGHLVKFAKPTDIYGLGGTLYYLLSGLDPHSVTTYSNEDEDLRDTMSCSDQTKDAVVKCLMTSPEARPQNVQEFLNLFPGCENIKLTV